jgi:lysophospholipase
VKTIRTFRKFNFHQRRANRQSLHPQIQPPRKVDVIFAVDSSADHGGPDLAGFPNGTALIATYERSKGSIANGTSFPAVPDWNTFVNLGLSTTPTFFGCESKNTTSPAPLIVYLPNAPYDHWSNLSTKTTHLKDVERSRMIENGYNVATMANASLEENWPACVGCAVLARSFERSNTIPPKGCQDCFQKHCWNGTVDTKKPDWTPSLLIKGAKAEGGGKKDKKNSGITEHVSWPMMFAAFICIFTVI